MAHRRLRPYASLSGFAAFQEAAGPAYSHIWSIDLDGSTEQLREYRTTAKLGPNPDFTVLLWVKPVSTGANLSLVDIEGSGGNWNHISIKSFSTASGLRFDVSNLNNSAFKNYDLAGGLDLGSWGCYGVSYEGSGATIKCYKNGSDITSSMTKTVDSDISSRGDNLYKIGIGANAATSEKHAGVYHMLAIWDEQLTDAEIAALYNSGSPFDYRNNQGDYTSSANLSRLFWLGDLGPSAGSSSTWGLDKVTGTAPPDVMIGAANVTSADVVEQAP
jgi:hypothetical protein